MKYYFLYTIPLHPLIESSSSHVLHKLALMLQVEAILATGGKYYYDDPTQSFYVVKGDQWISVEKPDVPPSTSASNGPIGSIASKAYFIQQQGLAGAMFWEVSKP